VGQREYQRRLVGAGRIGELRRAAAVGQYQKTGEVVLVGLDAAFEDFESVEFRSFGAAEPLAGDFAGASRRVVALDDFHRGPGLEVFAALHQGDRVRMHLADVRDPLSRKRRQHVRDAELVLADDRQRAAAQQFVVRQQASGDGVFDGRHPQQLRVGRHAGELLVETHAGQHFDLFAGETSVRRRLVETTRYPLYRYPFHLLNRIKKSRSSAERDPSCFHSIVLYS
jgi:hypothetical protein